MWRGAIAEALDEFPAASNHVNHRYFQISSPATPRQALAVLTEIPTHVLGSQQPTQLVSWCEYALMLIFAVDLPGNPSDNKLAILSI